jgi:hypothetical protein
MDALPCENENLRVMILEQKWMTVEADGNQEMHAGPRNVVNGARLRWSHEIVLPVQEANLAPRRRPHPTL